MRSGIRNRGGFVTLTGLVEVKNRDGTLRRYLRHRGKIVAKLPGDVVLSDPAFLAAYAEARAKIAKKAGPGSIDSIITTAMRSDRVKGWSPVYRAKIRRNLDLIRAKAGHVMARAVQEVHIQADVDAADDALGRLKAWRFICGHGRRIGLLGRDPAAGVKVERKQTDGFPPWTAAEIAAYRARWPYGTVARAAMELLFWTGARVSDVVLIGPGHVGKDGVLAFRQGKTGGWAYVPWSCQMPPFADLTDLAHVRAAVVPSGHMTFLATVHGKTRSHRALGHQISEWCEAAGFDRSAHGLRKSRLASLAERGATTQQIMAWGGHASMSEVEHYTRSAARRSAVVGKSVDTLLTGD